MPKIKRANKNILQRPLAKIWAAIFASLGTQRKERPAMISISQEFRKVLKELYQLGGVEKKCIAYLLLLIGKENYSVQNSPMFPKTKWITLQNLAHSSGV